MLVGPVIQPPLPVPRRKYKSGGAAEDMSGKLQRAPHGPWFHNRCCHVLLVNSVFRGVYFMQRLSSLLGTLTSCVAACLA